MAIARVSAPPFGVADFVLRAGRDFRLQPGRARGIRRNVGRFGSKGRRPIATESSEQKNATSRNDLGVGDGREAREISNPQTEAI